jgi:FAD-linked oxidoreductase
MAKKPRSLTRRALLAGGVVGAGIGGVALLASNARPVKLPPPGPAGWRNWSGSQHCDPAAIAVPADETELCQLVKTAKGPIRPVGSGHSFTPLVPTDGTIVSLDRLHGIVEHDDGAKTATIRAGTRLAEMSEALDALGQSTEVLPDINKQTLAGALSTSTHGTGIGFGSMSSFIERIKLVTAAGEIIECGPDQETEIFNAARVGLGALGILTEVKLRNRARLVLERNSWFEPIDQLIDKAQDLARQHRHFEFYALPFTGMGLAIANDESSEAGAKLPPTRDTGGLDDLRDLRDWLAWAPPLRRITAKAIIDQFGPEKLVAPAYQLLSTERPIRFNEMEYHIPRDSLASCLRQVIATLETKFPASFFPIEARFIKEDDIWLSPFSGRPSCSIAVHVPNDEAYQPYFAAVEPIYHAVGGRPHWGKLHTLTAKELAPLYPHWEDFKRVRLALDPQGKFMTPYLQSLLG